MISLTGILEYDLCVVIFFYLFVKAFLYYKILVRLL